MERYIQRETYLRQLMDRMGNGEVKIITGPRRSGKSWLLNRIFKDYLLEQGVAEDNIVIVSFDMDDDEETGDLTDRQALKSYLYSRITDDTTPYYIILDEVQEVEGFEKLVNGLNARDNVDVYITGSNSHFLSSDIKTIFRGRGDEVKVWPFSFREFCTDRTEPVSELWKEYYTYGGMPGLLRQRTSEQKVAYLQRLWNKTYLDDVVERHKVKNREALSALADGYAFEQRSDLVEEHDEDRLGIFSDRERADRRHVARLAGEMHGKKKSRTVRQTRGHRLGRHVVRARVDVGEYGHDAAISHTVGGSDKGVRRRDSLRPRLRAERSDGAVEGRSRVAERDAVFRPDTRGDRTLKLLDARPLGEVRRVQDVQDGLHVRLVDHLCSVRQEHGAPPQELPNLSLFAAIHS